MVCWACSRGPVPVPSIPDLSRCAEYPASDIEVDESCPSRLLAQEAEGLVPSPPWGRPISGQLSALGLR